MRQVNLLPEELRKIQKIRVARNSALLTLLPVVLLVGVLFGLLSFWVGGLEKKTLKPQVSKDKLLSSQFSTEAKKVESEIRKVLDSDKDIIESFLRASSTSSILKVIGNTTADKVWLTKLSFDRKMKSFQISGHSFNTRLVSEFMLELRRLPVFKNVALISMEKGEKGAHQAAFSIECKL